MTKKLCDYFPDAANGNGIFKKISSYRWFEGISPDNVDTYFYLMCGEKRGMPFLDKYADDTGAITGMNLDKLAKMLLNMNYNSWQHQYKALTVEYNPIENTDFTETIKDTTHEEGEGQSYTVGQMEMTNTNVTTGSVDNTTTDKVAGFNSSTNVDKGESSTTTDYGDSESDPVTVTNTTTTDYGTENDSPVTNKNNAESDKVYEREYRKHGNIGVTTNAQMISSDIEVWKLNKFYDILIMDICKVIALSIY
jgi:hypothetical protein